MNISLIGCPFRTTYGAYIESLRSALQRTTGERAQWIGSNCGCGDPVERNREFQTSECDYFEMPQIDAFRSDVRWKRAVRFGLRNALYYFRAAHYRELSREAEVVHLQQVLNATGSDAVFHWLRQPASGVARVVTVHELDAEQTERPARNLTYNRADAVIVHEKALAARLRSLGVLPELIHVVRHGTTVAPLPAEAPRQGLVYYCGHKPMSGKGMKTMFQAMAQLAARLGERAPRLSVHGHYGARAPAEAEALAREYHIDNNLIWLNQISNESMVSLYRSSQALILPFTGSFAGFPVGVAAANRLPIIATRNAGIPEHIGENGIWISEENPDELTDRIVELLADEAAAAERGARLRRYAEERLSWDVIARETFDVYRAAQAHALAGAPQAAY